jgi:hypothetical protein
MKQNLKSCFKIRATKLGNWNRENSVHMLTNIKEIVETKRLDASFQG